MLVRRVVASSKEVGQGAPKEGPLKDTAIQEIRDLYDGVPEWGYKDGKRFRTAEGQQKHNYLRNLKTDSKSSAANWMTTNEAWNVRMDAEEAIAKKIVADGDA